MKHAPQKAQELQRRLNGSGLEISAIEFGNPTSMFFAQSSSENMYMRLAGAVMADASSTSFRVMFIKDLCGDGQWRRGIMAFSLGPDDEWMDAFVELLLGNIEEGMDMAVSHAIYILEHDQPCQAVLSPFAYTELGKAVEEGPVACRRLLVALAKASLHSIDLSTRNRIGAFLSGKNTIPQECPRCRGYAEYVQLRKKIGF